jgi:tetratricopeptide (TPR) repeat protein
VALDNLGRYKEAIDNFDKAIEIDRNNGLFCYDRACYCSIETRIETAINSLEKAIVLDRKY